MVLTVWKNGLKSMDSSFAFSDLAVGPHLVVARYPGYQTLTEEVNISPNSTLERSYKLARRHGRWWYATRGGGALAVVGSLVAILANHGGGGTAAEQPLPGPPGPPDR